MSRCIFCDILAEKETASFLHRDETVSAFMDTRPITAGHFLVVPNFHAAELADMPGDAGEKMFRVAHRLALDLRQSDLRCDGVTMFLADGKAANQEIFHVHLHVFPRYEGDGFEMKCSEDYYTKATTRLDLEQTADSIRAASLRGVSDQCK